MRRIFIIKKYIVANTIQEAIERESKASIHECYMDENSMKNMVNEIDKVENPTGFKQQ